MGTNCETPTQRPTANTDTALGTSFEARRNVHHSDADPGAWHELRTTPITDTAQGTSYARYGTPAQRGMSSKAQRRHSARNELRDADVRPHTEHRHSARFEVLGAMRKHPDADTRRGLELHAISNIDVRRRATGRRHRVSTRVQLGRNTRPAASA
ncbi:hypothetical protein Aab01nite_30700 [Paractinoplanes abujensis]|nr:hypothetical protein Aab01nite_30700 [Actinoplanes abujensis]